MGTKIIPEKANPSYLNDIGYGRPTNQIKSDYHPIIEKTKWGDLLCYEEATGRWFRTSRSFVEKVINDFNKLIRKDIPCIGINQFIESLGLYTTQAMEDFGWRRSDLIPFEDLFQSEYHENGFKFMGEPVLVIYPTIPVVRNFTKEDSINGVENVSG